MKGNHMTQAISANETALQKKQTRARYILALGHMCTDINQGTLAAILPFLVAAYHYDYTTAALLVMASNLAGSIIQPIFGHMADKKNRPYCMLLGVCLAGGGMALTGFLSNFYALCVAVMISGIGIALFHPQAAKLVNATSGAKKKGTSMGVFSFGGNLGFTLGPILATLGITLFGLKGTIIFLIPPMLFGLALPLFFPKDLAVQAAAKAKKSSAEGKDDVWAFCKLGVLVTLRSIINSGISTFLVLYMLHVMHQSDTVSSAMLSCYYAMSALSALLGGRLADYWGEKKTIIFSTTLLAFGLIAFPMAPNIYTAALLLIPMGMGIGLCYSPMVISGQQYLPNHMGFASGVTLGLAVSIGGTVTPVLGHIADLKGLTGAFVLLGFLGAAIWITALFLKNLRTEPAAARAQTEK